MVASWGPAIAPATRQGAPRTYLLTVDQLVAPDFVVDVPAHQVSVLDIATTDSTRAAHLAGAGFHAGATVDFFRSAANIAVQNGPVQVADTVESFATAAGAASTLTEDVARLDAVRGATAVSTGALGDAAHATTRTVTDPASGVRLVEVSLEWRVDNLIDVLVVRGRDGGTRVDDALVLAHRQTITELGLPTPTPLPTAKSATAAPTTVPPARAPSSPTASP